jgi:hypothetical protein
VSTTPVAGLLPLSRRGRTVLDAGLALVAFGATVAMTAHGTHSTGAGATLAIVLAAVSSLPLLMWRRAPVAAFAIGHGGLPALQLALGALVWALAWFAGDRLRLRRREVAELHQRALQAERDAERERRLARLRDGPALGLCAPGDHVQTHVAEHEGIVTERQDGVDELVVALGRERV